MDNEIRETIERFKIKAEGFLRNNQRTFIVDIKNTYYFCYIIFVGEDSVHVQNFKGSRKAEKERIYWSDVLKFEEYKERGISE